MEKTIIFYWRRPTPPLFIGGAEKCHNILAEELTKKNIRVIYVGSLEDPNFPSYTLYNKYLNDLKNNTDVTNLNIDHRIVTYIYKGINCITMQQNYLSAKFKDIVLQHQNSLIVTSMEKSFDFVKIANKFDVKTFVWLHSCFDNEIEVIKAKPTIIASVSNFVKNYIYNKYKMNTLVFRPQFHFNNTKPDYDKRKYVTFVNPVPQKGCDFILRLASMMPNVKFLCVEGWYKNSDFISKMPNNIIYLEPQNDMSYVWSVSKILLVPSIVQDASPRVIVEANMNYIPVIGNCIGGIPEVMNSSGYIIDVSDIEKWIETINYLLNNERKYFKISEDSYKASLMFKRDFVSEFLKIIEIC